MFVDVSGFLWVYHVTLLHSMHAEAWPEAIFTH